MTNTDTADAESTIAQVEALALAGSEIVRVTVNNEEAAAAVPTIVEGLDKRGIRVPIVGDFHYNGHLLLKKFPATAKALAKYRINPGNVSVGRKDDNNFLAMIQVAIKNDRPVRIGLLQRYATDAVFRDNTQLFSRAPDTGREIAIVGGGPAGLSCAHRLSMLGHKCVVFEPWDKLGGLNE